jgi:hypothetical protein
LVATVGVTVIEEVVEPVFQEYVLAPVAVKVATEPIQIVLEEAATVGVAFTITLKVLVLVHPAVVPVTV